MPSALTLQTIGDWQRKVAVTTQEALAVSMDVTGRDGEQACSHCIILMAQSSRARTPQAKATRPVERNPEFEHLLQKKPVNQYKAQRMAGMTLANNFRFRATKYTQRGNHPIYANNRRQISRIPASRRGLARRSWMWSLPHGKSIGRPIPGISELLAVKGPNTAGYELRNKLSYVVPIMPPGWEQQVQTAATNKIMKQAALRIEKRWQSDVTRRRVPTIRPIGAYFGT